MFITFLPASIKVPAQKGDNLLHIAGKANVFIDGSCGGKGTCGRCKVQVVYGVTSPLNLKEQTILTEKEINEGYRLACCLTVEDDMIVFVPHLKSASSSKSNITLIPDDFTASSIVKKYHIILEGISLKKQMGDLEKILKALPEEDYTIVPSLLMDLSKILRESKSKVTVVTREKQIIALEAGDTRNLSYGVAFDIGTTTIVGMLWDLNHGELVHVSAKSNPQSVYGADVISRIDYCSREENRILQMQSKIIECLNDIINDFRKNIGVESRYIYESTVVGNTTMSHLFLGVNPTQLAKSPFDPVFCSPVDIEAKDMKIDMNAHAQIHLLPNIAGHVGSDMVGVLLASRIMETEGLNLAIDVGTNGEIVLAQNGQAVTCSTAAGPAFEGGSIYQGVRAVPGAIEGMRIQNGEVILDIIDNLEPIGICGSGLIDTMAQMLDAGIIDVSGRIMDVENAKEKGVHPSLLSRLRMGKNGDEFVLVFKENDEDIVITQKDVREVQLAKGAIYGGIVTLLNELGADLKQIHKIFIAGAFGNYIKKESAIRIGLLPHLDLEKIKQIGNAAGTGASMALLSLVERKKAHLLAERVKHIELAMHEGFQTEFFNAMNFPFKIPGDV